MTTAETRLRGDDDEAEAFIIYPLPGGVSGFAQYRCQFPLKKSTERKYI